MEKPGYKTTEFWLSLAAMLVGAIMASGVLQSEGTPDWFVQVVGIGAALLGGLGYTVGRGYVKANARKADALVAASGDKPNPT